MSSIRLFVMDVDGTLTDGLITYSEGGAELKSFHARDGAGIRLLTALGIEPALLSGRTSVATTRRAQDLGITRVAQGKDDKESALWDLCAEVGCNPQETAYIGDDLGDLPAIRLARWSAAPADAASEVLEAVTYRCRAGGGRGAVREAIEVLLRTLGLWDQALQPYRARERKART